MKKTTLLVLLLFGVWTSSFGQASLCEDAESITLPFSTFDDTDYYGNNYDGYPGSSCGTPNNFLYGNDVVYAYTATFTGSINLYLSTDSDNVGLFAYANCSEIGQNCIAGVTNQQIFDNTISIQAMPVEEGNTYYFVISTWAPPETASYSLDIAENTCTNATATYTLVSDCVFGEEFSVAIDITDLGSATSLTVSDDYGAEQNVTATGTVTFGPYSNGISVFFKIANDQDANCVLSSTLQTFTGCMPVNNFCSSAIDLSLETSPLMGTTLNASNQNIASCDSFVETGDVYYSILVPEGYTLTIGQTENDYDSVITAFIGNCDEQIELTCFDEDDLDTFTYMNNSGEDKTFYWVQDGFNGQTGNFTLAWNLSDCVMPEAGYTIVPDCENGNQFLVIAALYTLGSASSVTISDDQSSEPQTLTETGQVQFGPYDNMTPVIFTVTNNEDASCFLESEPVTQESCPSTCTNATVNFAVELDCVTNLGFFVNANVTDMGTATSFMIDDDQEIASQNITATGTYQFGPYPDYTNIIFTVSDDLDESCVQTYSVQSYTVCPPANNECSDAIALIPGADLGSGGILTTNSGGTPSPELPLPSCGNMYFSIFGKDVWFTVTVPSSGNITIETTGSGEPGFAVVTDSVLQLYSGDCAALSPIVCDNDGGTDFFSMVSLTGRTPGEVLYIRAFGANGTQGSFIISAYDASLSTGSFDTSGFTSYPNPVNDILNISHTGKITNVAVYNILGQEVVSKNVNASHSKIDMSDLAKGTYLVKVTGEDGMKVIKVVKG
ncbi:hypothetical protein J2X31_003529 [Flavobacterium arsenatis]|uniref:Secretion system C-terminal sorting domain-containing protein n=1 Tax=Flavobacterium arsenatis TaxID=1484332 RepID=A0ABU1TUE0_9FLAO|nr:T9SS type A sorting domain-containing protein [Flavobacterium arsenatis]MDR6969496.1 hypothetical protein [Flavobacterium arsenatis]